MEKAPAGQGGQEGDHRYHAEMRGQGKVLPDHQRPEPGADESRQPHIPWKNGNSVFPLSASDRLAWVLFDTLIAL